MCAVESELRSEEEIGRRARVYFSHCPFCGIEYSMSFEESPSERYMFCKNCGRKWSIRYTLGTIWFLRTNDPQQKKEYTGSWIVRRDDRSLIGIRPYLLLETSRLKIGKQRIVEQGLDSFVWKVEPLLEHFDRYDRLINGHSCERIKVAFACARTKARREREADLRPGLSVKQVAAVTSLSELEASICTQRLLNEGLIYYEARPEKSLSGMEAVIVGFLGEPLYQMNEVTAEKIIKELIK